ncbi:MAG: hypothetical protein JXA89_23130 [Anaerolineae bacterium]|nr:hypothetical protein [Anaerolineae bacterium]
MSETREVYAVRLSKTERSMLDRTARAIGTTGASLIRMWIHTHNTEAVKRAIDPGSVHPMSGWPGGPVGSEASGSEVEHG